MSVALPNDFSKGSRLLLAQCRFFAEWERGRPVGERLEAQLGRDLARKLLYALVRPSKLS